MVTVPAQYQADVNWAAQQLGIPASVVAAQINLESGFNPSAVSPAGAEGIAQFLPSTFAAYGTGSPFNATDAFHAYVNYMKTLLAQFHGNVRDALAAYNAGPGNLSAGYGYADTVLSNAGTGLSITAGSPGGTGPPGNVVTTGAASFNPVNIAQGIFSAIGGAWQDYEVAANVIAEPIALFAEFFEPGQAYRIGAAAVGAGAVFASVRLYGKGTRVTFPLAVGLAGIATIGFYMAARPWPEEGGKAIRPGPYVIDILRGKPPAPGPAPESHKGEIADVLEAFGIAYLASKIASAAVNAKNAAFGIWGQLF